MIMKSEQLDRWLSSHLISSMILEFPIFETTTLQ
jgi:hypothetical protein